MNYSKKVVLMRNKISKSTNEGPVCLRITINRQTTYKKLFRINPKFWDDKNERVKKGHPEAAEMNSNLTQLIANIEADMLKLDAAKKVCSVSDIRNGLLENKSLDLFKYADVHILQLYEKEQYGTYKSYKCTIDKLKNYVKKKEFPINTIDSNFIKKYELYLSQVLNNKPTTIGKEMKNLAKLMADIYDANNLNNINNPFRKYKKCRKYSSRDFLEESEIIKIEDLRINLQSPLYDAREVFLFECYTGLRISDILLLKWRNVFDNCLKGIAKKTKKQYEVPIFNLTRKLLERKKNLLIKNGKKIDPNDYVFNILTVDYDFASKKELENNLSSKTTIINKRLKRIAEMAEIRKNLSTHIGRHSLASSLLDKGANIYFIKEILSHGDVRITQEYAKMKSSKIYETMNLLNR